MDKQHMITKLQHLQVDVPFYSDANRLSIVLTSLLSNAFQFRDNEREAIVAVDVVTTATTATVIIKDNGIGIEGHILPRIFGMFYRGCEESQGAGLGLYIVQEVLSRLGGKIDVASTLGIGTTVTVTLPNMQDSATE